MPPRLPPELGAGEEPPLTEVHPSTEGPTSARTLAKIRVREAFIVEDLRSNMAFTLLVDDVGPQPNPLVLERLGDSLGDLKGTGLFEVRGVVAEEST